MFSENIKSSFFRTLENLEYGRLNIISPDGISYVFEGKNPGAEADISLENWSVISKLAAQGDIGFAEDYKLGQWSTSDLTNLLLLGLQNDSHLNRFLFGGNFSNFMVRLFYKLRANTLNGSKKNIHYHYDLGNEFYKLWLDPTMTYSSALFKAPSDSLESAQNNKYDRILERLGSQSGELLEVGCGWGGFADRALQKGDYGIKGLTLSEEQHDYATKRLNQNARIALEDYRIQENKYDHIVSIEMFEAVGEKYWPTYFKQIAKNLKKNGRAVIQTITIDESHFERYRKTGDMIRSFIFPGGMLPSPTRFYEEAQKAGLRVEDTFFFGQDYAKTLELWLKEFENQLSTVKTIGFDDPFIRLWRFYLAACIAGFKTQRTDVMQVELRHAD